MKTIFLFLFMTMMAHAALALELQYQAGANVTYLSTSSEHTDATTLMPTAAIGYQFSQTQEVFVEGGVLKYQVDKPGNDKLLKGTIGITGLSLAGIYTHRIKQFFGRLGVGLMGYQYDNTIDSSVKEKDYPLYKVTEDIDPGIGQQFILGADYSLQNTYNFGFDFRYITIKPNVERKATTTGYLLKESGYVDFTHSIFAFRFSYLFGN